MSDAYATTADVIALWKPLSADESERVESLLPIISDELRYRATLCHKDLDEMIALTPVLANVAKEVVVTVVSRILRQNVNGEPMSQESQSGLGYSWSGTYAIPAGGIGNSILPGDLKRLGIRRPRVGVMEFYDPRNGHNLMD